jgi:8-oxo-dGTP pyrophosphatase MutT (NUDIX family)
MTTKADNAPIPATTVLLLKDTADDFEVFMVTRHHKIDFASGALVFPGGKLDPQDSSEALLTTCRGQEGTGGMLSDDELAVRICGIRETFEEAGVLLARDNKNGEVINGARCGALARKYREAIHSGEVSLLDLIEKEEITLACDQLILFARWVTPSFFPKRFDAFFFLAQTPEDQVASHDDIESTDSLWTTPVDALADADEDRKTVVFATRMNLVKLAQFDSVDAVIKSAAESAVVIVEPGIEEKDGNVTYSIPLEAGYGISEFTEYGGSKLKIKSQDKAKA